MAQVHGKINKMSWKTHGKVMEISLNRQAETLILNTNQSHGTSTVAIAMLLLNSAELSIFLNKISRKF